MAMSVCVKPSTLPKVKRQQRAGETSRAVFQNKTLTIELLLFCLHSYMHWCCVDVSLLINCTPVFSSKTAFCHLVMAAAAYINE